MSTDFLSLTELAKRARLKLNQYDWDYLIGGSDTEASLRRNRHSVDSWVFKPRILNNVETVTTRTALLGATMRVPVVLAPIGSIQAFEAGGAESVARAAEAFGVLQIVSSVCEPDFETLAARTSGPKVYQLYQMGDRGWLDEQLQRTVAAGYAGFCLTADTQVYSRRERDIMKRYVPRSGRQIGVSDFSHQARLTWETVEYVKSTCDLPLLIKGVATAEDAARCAELGVDVIYVSNHGGRQLDHTRGCLDALPEVVDAVAGRAPVVVDGGFMRGADVVKALCLGATAVGLGRLQALALAAGGEAGVRAMLELLEAEIRITLALAGVASVHDCRPELVQREQSLATPGVLSAFPLLDEGY